MKRTVLRKVDERGQGEVLQLRVVAFDNLRERADRHLRLHHLPVRFGDAQIPQGTGHANQELHVVCPS